MFEGVELGEASEHDDRAREAAVVIAFAHELPSLMGLAFDVMHDKDLKIVGVDCHPGMNGRYTCEVGFVKTDYDRTRVFLDAALVERSASKDWTLLRGLCRRLL